MNFRIEKPVEVEIWTECSPRAFTGKFSSVNTKSDPEKDCLDDEHKNDHDDDSEEIQILFSALAVRADREVAGELLVDPVYLERRRAFRIVGYLQSWSSKHKHKNHDKICKDYKICMLGMGSYN